MGDRGNIAVIQDKERKEQVWFYGHWSGWRMPAVLQHAIIDGKSRWNDPSYFARIVFCRLVSPGKSYYETTSFGISTCIGDNEHPIIVADCAKQIVFTMPKDWLTGSGKVPADFAPDDKCKWTFEEYANLEKLPFGATLEEHRAEITAARKATP